MLGSCRFGERRGGTAVAGGRAGGGRGQRGEGRGGRGPGMDPMSWCRVSLIGTPYSRANGFARGASERRGSTQRGEWTHGLQGLQAMSLGLVSNHGMKNNGDGINRRNLQPPAALLPAMKQSEEESTQRSDLSLSTLPAKRLRDDVYPAKQR